MLGGIRQHGLGVRGQLAASTVSTSHVLGPLRLVLLSPSMNGNSGSENVSDPDPRVIQCESGGARMPDGCLLSFSQLHSVGVLCQSGFA